MMLILLRNHFKRNRSSSIKINAKNIMALLAIGILSIGLVGLMGFILYQITETFNRLRLDDVYLTVVFFVLIIVLTLYEIVNIIKQLYENPDNQIYLKLPINKETLFLSKIIYLYLKQIMISVMFLSLTAGVFGFVSHASIFYYVRLFIIALALPILPLSIASVLSIPVSYLVKILKKNRALLLIGLIAVLGVLFVGYIGFVQLVLRFINLTQSSSSALIKPEVIEEIKRAISTLRLSGLFTNMLVYVSFKRFIFSLGVLLLLVSVFASGAYALLKRFYFKALDSQSSRITHEAKKVQRENGVFLSLFKKEFKTLVRNPNYAFSAIVMNLLMPIFIFFTIKLAAEAGELAVGKEIVPGITVLTILIFVLLSNGFQGTIISREKDSYYISKIIPVPQFKQIIARISFGYILSILMLLLSVILIIVSGFISWYEGLFVFFIAVVFLFGYTFSLVYRDYKNPQLTSNEGGFDEGLNMYSALLPALLIAVFLGLITIGIPYIVKLFPSMRKFKILNRFIIELTDVKVSLFLYGLIFVTIFTYATIGFVKLTKAVKKG